MYCLPALSVLHIVYYMEVIAWKFVTSRFVAFIGDCQCHISNFQMNEKFISKWLFIHTVNTAILLRCLSAIDCYDHSHLQNVL